MTPNPIHELLNQTASALSDGQYLHAALCARQALTLARADNDFDTMRRVCMPMLEAFRYLRQNALETGIVRVITGSSDIPDEPDSSCYLFAPNFVGADALRFRTAAHDAGIAPFVLTREPTTAKNLCPIVAVAERVVRVRITPPDDTPTTAWFSAAAEALGDQAIADALDAASIDDPPAWIVDDFLDRLDACPEHEKFIMALADACANATAQPLPSGKRRRGLIDDPYSF